MARVPRMPSSVHGARTPIVGIDVETANPQHGAVCAIGVSVVQRGSVLRERHWYINPVTRFDPRFVAIHGITPERVRGAPTLRDAWSDVHRFISATLAETRSPNFFDSAEQIATSYASDAFGLTDEIPPLFVAHNAQFDRMQIERALGSPLPFRLACTVAMSRRAFPQLDRHNLAAVSAHLRITLQHHDALSDARACALIAYRCIAGPSK